MRRSHDDVDDASGIGDKCKSCIVMHDNGNGCYSYIDDELPTVDHDNGCYDNGTHHAADAGHGDDGAYGNDVDHSDGDVNNYDRGDDNDDVEDNAADDRSLLLLRSFVLRTC